VRIIQVVPRFPPAIGGMEKHAYEISLELVKRGHQVAVVTSNEMDECGRGVSEQRVNGIEVYRYPLFLPKLFREFWLMPRMIKMSENLDGDIIHAHGYRCLCSCVAAYVSKLKEIPMVLTPHGIFPPRGRLNAIAKWIFDRSLGNSLMESVDKVIALTESNKSLLLKTGARENKIVIIENGVRVDKYENLSNSEEIKKKYGFSGPVLLYVGRIDWRRTSNLGKIVGALPSITQKFCGAKLFIVGPDYAGYSLNLLDSAQKFGVEDSVVVTGSVTEEQLLVYYSMADIFIIPSIYEGLSLSMLEAMASKVPIIALSSEGTGGVLTHGENAILLKSGDPDEISDSISLLLSNSEVRERVRQNAFDLILRRYTWEAVVDKLESLYEDVLKNH